MSICSKTRIKDNSVETLRKELDYIRKIVCSLQGGSGTIVPQDSSSLSFSGDGSVDNPLTAQVTLSTNGQNSIISASNGLYSAAIPRGNGVVYHDIEKGGITDGVLAVTKAGALSTATIDKVGNFDRLAVTGGSNTSIITFDDKFVCDTQAIIRFSVKISDLNIDGSSGTSKIGLGTSGVQNTGDTGGVISHYSFFDIIGKTGVTKGGGGGENASIVTASAGTLVANGQILDIEFRNDLKIGQSILTIVNRTTGEFAISKSPVYSTIDMGLANGKLRLMLTNATYINLSLTVSSNAPKNNVVQVLGDSMASSYTTISNLSLVGRFRAISPVPIIVSSGNGAYWKSIATMQMQEVFKIQPKYVTIISILPLNNSAYDSGDSDYAAFIANFNTVINGILSFGGVPILTKWGASNFYGPTIGNAWNTFLDGQKVLFPAMQFLDLTQFPTLQYNDFFGHPSSSDWVVIAAELDKVLKTLGY